MTSALVSAWRAKFLVATNSVARAAQQSLLRVLGMGGMAIVTALLSFLIFSKAFSFLARLEVVGPVILVRLLSLFFFVLFGNILGLLPYAFTYTSHIAVTFALALLVIVVVTVVALRIHGLHFFSYFFPEGAPKLLAPLIIPIEVISYLSRPVSLSIRLFANMVAGHVMFEVFAAFILLLASAGYVGTALGIVPLALNVVLVGFELLVAGLQAYVFAILTCIYLHDAVHLH